MGDDANPHEKRVSRAEETLRKSARKTARLFRKSPKDYTDKELAQAVARVKDLSEVKQALDSIRCVPDNVIQARLVDNNLPASLVGTVREAAELYAVLNTPAVNRLVGSPSNRKIPAFGTEALSWLVSEAESAGIKVSCRASSLARPPRFIRLIQIVLDLCDSNENARWLAKKLRETNPAQ